jgi:lipopolysaccharide transport system permease protein
MAPPDTPELVLEAGHASRNYWRDIWRYRELFYFLTWRDILVRYKQTSVGIAWAVIRPFLTMVVFTFVFSRIAKVPAPGSVPYPLLVMAGMLPWQFFSTALNESSNSLVGNANLISKIYFPRLIIPAGSVITSFVDFAITLGLMGGMMVWYRFCPDWRIVFLPAFVALAFGAAFGAGLLLCTLNVKYRDFRYVIPFIVQFGLYLSPVGFDSSVIPERWLWLYSLNPMVGVIDGFRWALLGGQSHPTTLALVSSVAVTVIVGALGLWGFRRMERTFADVI